MRIRSALVALTLLPGAAFAVAAHVPENCVNADDGGTEGEPSDDILLCTETHYLSCVDTLDPAGKLHDPTVTTIKLTTEAPATSFTEGGGCGYPEDPVFSGTVQDTMFNMDFGGFVTTNIDTMTVEIHDLGPHENALYAANGTEVELDVRITIDGQSPFGSEENASVDGTISKSPLTLTVPVTAELSETGLSSKYVFTVTNIGADLPELLDVFGEGAGVFHGVQVTIEFPATPHPAGALPSDNVAPVWGATEVPASIVLNGPVVGTEVDALLHN